MKKIAYLILITNSLQLAANTLEADAKLLYDSKYKAKFYPLVINFVTQEDFVSCGFASATIVLNSLNVKAKPNSYFKPYQYLHQHDLKQKTPTQYKFGLNLEQLANLLQQYRVDTKIIRLQSKSPAMQLRQLLKKHLEQADTFMIVNYDRKYLKQKGRGHFSPIAAYNQTKDLALVLDVARYKYQPFWVKVADLAKAVNTLDKSNKKMRGVLIIKKPGTRPGFKTKS